MTPQERALVTELFDRLAALETTPRDPEAERVVAIGLARSPNATYALVQTVLLQNEALKQAEAHANAAPAGSFLDSARKDGLGHGSVPTVPLAPKWNTGRVIDAAAAAPAASSYSQEPAGHGGSFLGTAAAAAVGVIGGSLLFNGLRNMMGGPPGSAFGSPPENGARPGPWSSGDASHGELARDAGVGDITNSGGSSPGRSAGLFDDDTNNDGQQFTDNDSGFDDGVGGDAGGDTA